MTNDPYRFLMEAGAIAAPPFEPNSRYDGVPLGRYAWPSGATAPQPPAAGEDASVPYVLRRFIPQRRDIAIAAEQVIRSGDRPDLLAARTLGDAELYWRVADANAVVDPNTLTDLPGRRVRIPRPVGF